MSRTEERQPDQRCRADRKALANRRGGVAGGIEGIGALAHGFVKLGHLGNTCQAQQTPHRQRHTVNATLR
jgi:hypothetical protein